MSNKMRVLVTGAAGFIGFHLTLALLDRDIIVVGIDNLNNYYDPSLKQLRLEKIAKHPKSYNFSFNQENIADRGFMSEFFNNHNFDVVVNLAAQAGVRHSIENPQAYVESNLVGFVNILEGCRHSKVKHLIYASSSSVYGSNLKQPFSTDDQVDHPISLYGATKKSNELMAHTYSHLYNIRSTGLRFFTVYGPYGRPDMAYYKFTKCILSGEPIDVYNNGDMKRDFTYIDDVVISILRIMNSSPANKLDSKSGVAPNYEVFNIGNNSPVTLRDFISAIETSCGRKAKENKMPMQPGDVLETYADIDPLMDRFAFKPLVPIHVGIEKFVSWYQEKIQKRNDIL